MSSSDLKYEDEEDDRYLLPFGKLSRFSPSNVLDTKTKEDTLTSHTIELLPTPASDQQSLISGYQVVKVCRNGISPVIQSKTFEALPHPTKLFRRRKQFYTQQMTKASKRSLPVKQHDKDNQSVAIHLRQLRSKQSRIDANKESDQTNLSDQISLSRNATNSMTATMVSRTVKPSLTTSISDWEAIESWIHGRWKSNSVYHINKHIEEE
ncbi:uncharacterized protein LOC117334127 isoform X2 [Pecten maximus]|uniref:uncharacterized protein LOC117334127 isoform X2 n=1 Tax=Pecten maximus TaxID=6579 RepID=UPI0014591070|nr:uncharacterized protein LOC117334127 isoform X2 [Pecten maximus]